MSSVAFARQQESAIASPDEEFWLANMATFATPEFARNQVDKAGFILATPQSELDEFVWALHVINNWRASHAFPLNNFTTNLRYKVKAVQSDVLIAQRIKRLESITAKLTRDQTSTLQLSQMQDIGGCRAILKSPQNVEKLVDSYKHSRFNHKLKSEKDYISSPKSDGYRATTSFISIKVYLINIQNTTSSESKFNLGLAANTSGQPLLKRSAHLQNKHLRRQRVIKIGGGYLR